MRFQQEKALVGAFSVITNLRMELFEALVPTPADEAQSSTEARCEDTVTATARPSIITLCCSPDQAATRRGQHSSGHLVL